MPKFLDVHPLKGLDEDTLRKLQNAPIDEFQVKPINLMYNQCINNGIDSIDDSLFTTTSESSSSPGSSILVFSTSRNNDRNGWYIGGDSIGQRGKRAETVGIEASNRFLENYLKNVPIDYRLADMLVLPLSLIKGRNLFRVAKITEHLKTNLYVISKIVDGCKFISMMLLLPLI